MNERCNDLDLFFDAELVPSAADAFRDHLGGCEHCQNMLHGRMLEAAILFDAAPAGRADHAAKLPAARVRSRAWDNLVQLAARVRRPAFTTVSSFVAAAAAILLLVPRAEPPEASSPAAALASGELTLAAKRSVDVRFSSARLDQYRPREIQRGIAQGANEQIDLQAIAELKQRNEIDAVVGALALNGDMASAQRHAANRKPSAESLSDRAALELLADQGRRSDDAAVRALSFARSALRRKPSLAQARWNEAIALEQLGLARVAAKAFAHLAQAHDHTGWTDEARQRAHLLELRADRDARNWAQYEGAADVMRRGGVAMTRDEVAVAPNLARDALYQAVALAATPERLDELAPIAAQLDKRYMEAVGTAPLAALVERARAGLALHGELAPSFLALDPKKPEQLDALQSRARARNASDIALASFLIASENLTTSQLARLQQLATASDDPWWRTLAATRAAYAAQFGRGDFLAIEAIARSADDLCAKLRNSFCTRLTIFAAGANSELGRVDLALEQLGTLRAQVRDAGVWKDEASVLHAIGMAQSKRASTELDTASIASAFLEESALRRPSCDASQQHFDFVADAELGSYHFDEAAAALAKRDALLASKDCAQEEASINGETVRLRLLLRGHAKLEDVQAGLAKLVPDTAAAKERVEVLRAIAMLVVDRQAGRASLQQLIARMDAPHARPQVSEPRTLAFEALIDDAANDGDGGATRVLQLLADRIGTPVSATCALGVASWNRRIVALRDRHGAAKLEVRAGERLSAEEVVSDEMRARLADCEQVHVFTSAPYFGAPRLLGPTLSWSYRAAPPRTTMPYQYGTELIVDQVVPPSDLHLPALLPFQAAPTATALSGLAATPAGVLAGMRDAELVVIVAHGSTDANEPNAASLVLSPDARGDYLLTASSVAHAKLTRAPIVVLAGCDAGRVQISAAPWSLATAFLDAGARVVIAPTAPIPDDEAAEVFQSLVARIRRGEAPMTALTTERAARRLDSDWLSSIVVFE